MNAVGIDVSKGKSMVAIMRPFGEIVSAPFETSIPTAFINCHSLRLLQWINTSFTHCLFNLLWCDANAPMAIQPA